MPQPIIIAFIRAAAIILAAVLPILLAHLLQ